MKLNEPTVLKVRKYTVVSKKKVPEITVMITGDWHVSPIVTEQQADFLKEAIEVANPDVIILQGDLVDSPAELKRETSLEKLMGELTGYRTLSYYQNAPLLFMDGINDTVIYKIFAIVDVNDIEISTIAKGQYDTPAEFHQFVTQMGNRSLINTGIMVEQQDSLLTVLCDTEKGKLAIIGRAVREGEDYTVDTSKATLNNGQNNVADWTVTATDWVTKTDVTATDRVNVQ